MEIIKITERQIFELSAYIMLIGGLYFLIEVLVREFFNTIILPIEVAYLISSRLIYLAMFILVVSFIKFKIIDRLVKPKYYV